MFFSPLGSSHIREVNQAISLFFPFPLPFFSTSMRTLDDVWRCCTRYRLNWGGENLFPTTHTSPKWDWRDRRPPPTDQQCTQAEQSVDDQDNRNNRHEDIVHVVYKDPENRESSFSLNAECGARRARIVQRQGKERKSKR
jgi:hypothetical protein